MPDTETADSGTTTILGIRLDATLRDKIKALAAAEGRTESGFVRYYLSGIVVAEEAKSEAKPD